MHLSCYYFFQVSAPYLVITFQMTSIQPGQHLRALDNLLDVYGFNITYQISAKTKQKDYTKNVKDLGTKLQNQELAQKLGEVNSGAKVLVDPIMSDLEKLRAKMSSKSGDKTKRLIRDITSKVQDFSSETNTSMYLKTSCSVLECRYLGHCFANVDYR